MGTGHAQAKPLWDSTPEQSLKTRCDWINHYYSGELPALIIHVRSEISMQHSHFLLIVHPLSNERANTHCPACQPHPDASNEKLPVGVSGASCRPTAKGGGEYRGRHVQIQSGEKQKSCG